MVQARLYDGTILNFPDGTDEEIINQTVQNYIASQGAVPQVEPVEEEETELSETLTVFYRLEKVLVSLQI